MIRIETIITPSFSSLYEKWLESLFSHHQCSYNYSGFLILKTSKQALNGQEILAELDESNSVLAVYTHSTLRTDDVLAADIRSNKLANQTGSYFYLKDGLGSVTDITNSDGDLVQHYSYSSFGKLLSIKDANGADGTANAPEKKTSFGYINREHSASGMNV